MPVIIGWFIGKLIGSMIVAIVVSLFRLGCLAVKLSMLILRYAFKASEWIVIKLWQGGRSLVDYYRLNLR